MNNTNSVNISNQFIGNEPIIYYSDVYKIIGTINIVVILSLGMVGNLLVVIVVYFSRIMHTPTNCFLVSLSIADMIALLSSTMPVLSEYFNKINHWNLGPAMCPIIIFLQYCTANASAMSITCFSFERWIAICRPLTAQVMCTLTRALKIVIGIWVFNLLYNSSWLYIAVFTYSRILNSTQFSPICTYRLKQPYLKIVYLSDLIIFYVTPLFVTTVLYIDIVMTLMNKKGNKIRIVGKSFVKESKIVSSKLKVIKMLITVAVLFALLWLPYRAWVVYNSFVKNKYLDLWFVLFVRCMVYINSAINPILYNAMSAKFRKAFKTLLTCNHASKGYDYPECSEIQFQQNNPHSNKFHGKRFYINKISKYIGY